MIWKGER